MKQPYTAPTLVAWVNVGDVVGQLQRLQELVVKATAATTVEGIARVLFDEATSAVGSVFGGMWLVAGDALEPIHLHGPSGDRGRVAIAVDSDTPLAASVRARAAIWIADSADYERRFPTSFARYRMQVGCVCLPLLVGDRAIGGTVFAFEGTRTFSDPERGALELLARQCAQAIDRLQLVEAEHAARLAAERVAARMTRLQAAVARLAAGRGEDDVARILIDESFAMIGANVAALWMRSGSEVNLVAQVGASRASVNATARIGLEERGALAAAMRTRQAVWLASRAEAAAAGYAINDARWDGISALVFLPLVVRDEPLGVLGMAFAENHAFEPSERNAIELFASHAAQALAREQENEAERVLGEISTAIASSLDAQTVLDRLAELSVARLGDFCTVDVERDGVLVRVAVTHADPEHAPLAARLRALNPLPGNVVDTVASQKPRLIAPLTDRLIERSASNPAHAQLLRDLAIRSAVSVPMMIGGRAVGAFTWGSRRRLFDERDLELAVRLAGLAAAAYENARLYAAEAATARRLAKHHELVAALSSARTPLDVCQATALKGVEALGACAALIWLRSDDGRLRLAGAAAPPEWAAQWAVVPTDPGMPANRVIATGEPVVVENAREYEEQARPLYAHAVGASRVNAFVTLPVTIAGVRTGVFTVSFAGDHHFTKDEHAFIVAIVRSCEQALERAQLYVNEANARREAEAVSRAKDTFVAMAGHGLRNRIGPIVSALDVMKLANVDGGAELDTIERQVRELDGLVEELLAIARGTALDTGIPLPRKRAKGSGVDPARTNRRSLRVLVVEDNVDMAAMLGNLLRRLGHEPVIAHDGPDALACAERDRPHLAFLDLGLPGMDGFELVRRLREQPAFAGVPVVALTGYGQASDRNRTREAGFVEHLVKPVDLEDLHAIVDRFS